MNNMDNVRNAGFHREFRHWDLNLLVALDALLAEGGNVTRAAERLAISQSAMSHALNRLRTTLEDPLFTKTGQKMVPSPRVLALAPLISSWLQQARELMYQPGEFDPGAAEGCIRIVLPEGFETHWLPPLLTSLFRQAPGIQIHAVSLPLDRIIQALDAGTVDLAIVGGVLEQHAWHHTELLLEVGFFSLHNPDLIDLPHPVHVADLARYPHIATSYVGSTMSVIDYYFMQQGLVRNKVVTSTSIAAIPAIVRALPLISILPLSVLLDESARQGLEINRMDASLSVPIQMLWHRSFAQDPVHRFVRDELKRVVRE